MTFSARGSAYGEAYLTGPNTIEATWFSSRLVGDVPGLGRVLFTTREDKVSSVAIETGRAGLSGVARRLLWSGNQRLSGSRIASRFFTGAGGRVVNRLVGSLYFPALADQQMHYDIHVFNDAGGETQALRSDAPMKFQAEIQAIPPLGTIFRTAADVDFFDLKEHSPVLRMLAGSQGVVDDAPGLQIELVRTSLDRTAQRFEGLARVTSLDRRPDRICWFVTPVRGAKLISSELALDAQFGDSLEIPVVISFEGTGALSGFIVQAFSSYDLPMEKHRVFLFRNF